MYYYRNSRLAAMVGHGILLALILYCLLTSNGCAYLPPYGGYEFTVEGHVSSITGTYRIVKADPTTVQYMFEKYGGNPRTTVEACTIWTKSGLRQIWYCTQDGLDAELFNIQSYRRLIDAHFGDQRAWTYDMVPEIGRIR